MSTERTSMDDLLSRRVVDEREKSPDDAPNDSIAESNEPEAFTDTEALPADATPPAAKTETQPAKTDDPAKPAATAEDDAGTETRGLPRAFHARVKAADERKRVAEERAATLERELADLKRRYEQGGQPQPQAEHEEHDDNAQPDFRVDAELHKTRMYYSEREAKREFGDELVAEAKEWAKDVCEINPNFNAAVYQSPDPIRFVIEAFRREQVEQQLAEHGWDLDKLVKARAGALQTQPAPATAPAASHTAQPTQPQPRMPNDFASSNSGGGRVNGDNAGPTPLSELLSVNARRR